MVSVSAESLQQFLIRDDGKPIVMLNLLSDA
jgi:hypothetical protein